MIALSVELLDVDAAEGGDVAEHGLRFQVVQAELTFLVEATAVEVAGGGQNDRVEATSRDSLDPDAFEVGDVGGHLLIISISMA